MLRLRVFILIGFSIGMVDRVVAHAISFDCRPCPQGWMQLEECKPSGHDTKCEECHIAMSSDSSEGLSGPYNSTCAPVKDDCGAKCPIGQFVWKPCSVDYPNYFACQYCDKAASATTSPEYKAACIATTTTTTTTIVAANNPSPKDRKDLVNVPEQNVNVNDAVAETTRVPIVGDESQPAVDPVIQADVLANEKAENASVKPAEANEEQSGSDPTIEQTLVADSKQVTTTTDQFVVNNVNGLDPVVQSDTTAQSVENKQAEDPIQPNLPSTTQTITTVKLTEKNQVEGADTQVQPNVAVDTPTQTTNATPEAIVSKVEGQVSPVQPNLPSATQTINTTQLTEINQAEGADTLVQPNVAVDTPAQTNNSTPEAIVSIVEDNPVQTNLPLTTQAITTENNQAEGNPIIPDTTDTPNTTVQSVENKQVEVGPFQSNTTDTSTTTAQSVENNQAEGNPIVPDSTDTPALTTNSTAESALSNQVDDSRLQPKDVTENVLETTVPTTRALNNSVLIVPADTEGAADEPTATKLTTTPSTTTTPTSVAITKALTTGSAEDAATTFKSTIAANVLPNIEATTSGHTLSAHDVAHGHNSTFGETSATTTTPETMTTEPYYEDANGKAQKSDKSQNEQTSSEKSEPEPNESLQIDSATEGPSNSTESAPALPEGSERNTASIDDESLPVSVPTQLLQQDQATGSKVNGSLMVGAVNNQSSAQAWINYIVISIIFFAILIIILAILIWKCQKKRARQVQNSDTMTQPIVVVSDTNGNLANDSEVDVGEPSEVSESPLVKVKSSAQHAAPYHPTVTPKKKVWGSRDFPWIDEDIKEPLA